MLSYTWSLYRSGLIGQNNIDQEVLTIINKKYMKLEKRVIQMIPEEYRGKFYCQFF